MFLSQKRILLLGGSGAFGQCFFNYSNELNYDSLTVFSRDEAKHANLKRHHKNVHFILGDITYLDDLKYAMKNVDVIIHAAAMKNVSECELNPLTSTRVNILGTLNVVRAFMESSAKHLVFLSSDKSCYPSSLYGAQKFIGERLIASASNVSQRAFSIRYSNVLESTGSVFHLFKELLSQGKCATVHSSHMVRGFLEQRDIVLALPKFCEWSRGGETFVMLPKKINILELANAMRDLMKRGLVDVKDMRSYHGEKLDTWIITPEEAMNAKRINLSTIMLDYCNHHKELSLIPEQQGITLKDCPELTSHELNNFLNPYL